MIIYCSIISMFSVEYPNHTHTMTLSCRRRVLLPVYFSCSIRLNYTAVLSFFYIYMFYLAFVQQINAPGLVFADRHSMAELWGTASYYRITVTFKTSHQAPWVFLVKHLLLLLGATHRHQQHNSVSRSAQFSSALQTSHIFFRRLQDFA